MWHRLQRLLGCERRPRRTIPDTLWDTTLQACPYLLKLAPTEQLRLRELTALFLED